MTLVPTVPSCLILRCVHQDMGGIAKEGYCAWLVFLYSTIHCLIESAIVRFIRFGRRHYYEVEAVFYIG
jgi:hypothetical protein